jgi:hypothetical protein
MPYLLVGDPSVRFDEISEVFVVVAKHVTHRLLDEQ